MENRAASRGKDAGDFPKVVLLDTVSFCNLKCSMCFHKEMERQKGFMPWPLFTKCIDEIAAADPATRVWMVFFGEALIRRRYKPTIFDMIAYAKSRGLTDVVLNSNANLLDEPSAHALIQAGLDGIYIGLDAFSPQTYAQVRVGGDYERTVQNVLGLLELKRAHGFANPEVYVQFVEMDVNAHEKEDFIAFWSARGANVKIRPKVSWAGKVDAPNLALGNDERWPCYWAMQTMSITDRGKVVTCAVDLDARFVAGDVTSSSIREVWNASLGPLRAAHVERRFDALPPHCRDCRDWQAASAVYYD
ncbi:MAG TPA: radical SAM protein [Candidatus Dormibacteraeota bacterium]|nr:radical SAM protein [Candidatus Dormibacteraeota bacterium]